MEPMGCSPHLSSTSFRFSQVFELQSQIQAQEEPQQFWGCSHGNRVDFFLWITKGPTRI